MSAAGSEPTAGSGLRLAVSLLTVVPVGRAPVVSQVAAGRAMAWAPVVGLVVGLVAGGVLEVGRRAGLPPLVAATLAVGVVTVLTRGLHLDGLADTADGLGSGAPRERALAVMRAGDIGPYGVVAVVLVLLLQVASTAAAGTWALVLALTTGRAALTLACRRGLGPARPAGLGALVAGSVGPLPVVGAVGLALLVALPTGVRGLVAVAAGLAVSVLVVALAVRRLGGITGDVLGAACECAVTAALVVSAASP